MSYIRSHDAVIRVYDADSNVIETHDLPWQIHTSCAPLASTLWRAGRERSFN